MTSQPLRTHLHSLSIPWSPPSLPLPVPLILVNTLFIFLELLLG